MNTLAIRSEDKNIWEKRTPLVPEHIAPLLKTQKMKVYVAPSPIRIFPDQAFADAGTTVTHHINQADIIIGVKEIPPEKIVDNKVYMFFSHTIKGQRANMPLLQKILDSKSTLIDYEKISDDHGRRLLYFGKYAGDAGAVDILWLIGQELLRAGIDSPLSDIKQALEYSSVAHAQQEIGTIGDKIRHQGFPEPLVPFVVGIFGYGNVSQGAQEIFDLFPVQRLEPPELISLWAEKKFDPYTLYLVIFHEEHMVQHRQSQPFVLFDYYQHPDHYRPVTAPYLPMMKLIVNAVYWEEQFPHFISQADVRKLWQQASSPPFLAIADLSCDIRGAMETTVKNTDSGKPAYKFNPLTATVSDDLDDEGILVLAVDNLPCEFASDSSFFFSAILKDYIPDLVQADFSKPLEKTGLPPALQKAVIAFQGELTASYHYLTKHLVTG